MQAQICILPAAAPSLSKLQTTCTCQWSISNCYPVKLCVQACVCACVRACAHACVRVRACMVRACARVCVREIAYSILKALSCGSKPAILSERHCRAAIATSLVSQSAHRAAGKLTYWWRADKSSNAPWNLLKCKTNKNNSAYPFLCLAWESDPLYPFKVVVCETIKLWQ